MKTLIACQKMAIAWRHINSLGEYDFTNEIKNWVVQFDPAKILALRVVYNDVLKMLVST